MVKSVFMSLWLMTLLAGSVYFFGSQTPEGDQAGKNAVLSAQYINMEPITAAIVRSNEVRGYLILEVAFALENGAAEEVATPLELVLRDLVLGHVHADRDLDIFKLEQYDIADLGTRLTEDINAKLGEKIVQDVLVQGVNFVSKEDVRDMLMRRS